MLALPYLKLIWIRRAGHHEVQRRQHHVEVIKSSSITSILLPPHLVLTRCNNLTACSWLRLTHYARNSIDLRLLVVGTHH